jgi:hypothetical protein
VERDEEKDAGAEKDLPAPPVIGNA